MKGYIYTPDNPLDPTGIYFVYCNYIAITKLIRNCKSEGILYEVDYNPEPVIPYPELFKSVPIEGNNITITKKLYENKKEKHKRKSEIPQNLTFEDIEKAFDDLFNVGSSD